RVAATDPLRRVPWATRLLQNEIDALDMVIPALA
ncbi:hypothetical protein PLA106_24888, partial [Pseudomonas amygdali pv. lachrymans str. M302278]